MEQENIEQINLDHINWKSSEEFFNSLRDELEKLNEKDESYNFTWVGKRKSIIEAGAPINKTLRPDINASKDFDNTKNMLIVGDNLDALKLLQESYLGKIKMIYIDPPYNTGHDFVYHDNFTVKKNDYEDNTTDSEGNKIISEDEFTENSKSNGRFHSDWLSMMYPRLKLARNLLADDGVIFISIDENEQANLRKICDEIFGEDNFESDVAWRRRANQPNDDSKMIATVSERILVYAKSSPALRENHTFGKMPLSQERLDAYTNPDNDPKGPWSSTPWCASRGQGGSRYTIKTPTGIEYDEVWLGTKETFEKNIKEGRMFFPNDGNGKPRKKIWAFERIEEGQPAINFWHGNNFGDNLTATSEFGSLFENVRLFDYTKPTKLVKNTIRLGTIKHDENSIILDFFAGSGTTGHAVMDLNAEDGGNRKYILVQLDEPTDEKSEAKKAGYDTIDQITAERLRRAGDKIIKEHPDLEGKLDTGFRVFHIDSANEREDVRKSVYDTKQEDMFGSIDNIKHDRTPLDLLFGTIIYMALPLDLKLEVRHIGDNTVYFYGYQDEGMGLIACFDDNISDNTIKEIARLKPLTAVFKDSSFKDSAAKINLSEIFRTISNETRVKVI